MLAKKTLLPLVPKKLTGGPSGKNAGFTCGATGALGNGGTTPVIEHVITRQKAHHVTVSNDGVHQKQTADLQTCTQ